MNTECLVQRRCVEITLHLVWIAPFQSFSHKYGTLIAISTASMFMTNELFDRCLWLYSSERRR